MKKIVFRALAAVLVFAAVIAAVIWFQTGSAGTADGYGELEAPVLPTVSFSFAGYETDVRYGYRNEETAAEEYLPLLPMDESRAIRLWITPYASEVKDVTVQLRSMDRERLIEEQTFDRFTEEGEKLAVFYEASALLEERTEYLLSVRVTLADGTESWYAVRAAQVPMENRDALLHFARQFSDATLSKDEEWVRPYLTQDTDRAGTDLSYVNLNNSASILTWAGLEPVAGERRLAVYEWEENQITVNFLYDCDTEYEGEKSSYEVEESFCVRLRDEKLYLLNYERHTEEIFAGNADSVGNTSILLGITSPEKLDMRYMNYGISVAFCVNEGVWHYDYNTNTLTKLFSFRDGSRDIRRTNGSHEIRLVDVDEKGNIYFYVLGYMNCGMHEGRVGLSLYAYEAETGELRECFFAESENPYAVLSEQAVHISCLNEKKLYYMDFEGSIYAIDLISGECLTLAENVEESSLDVSGSGRLAAWQEQEKEQQIFLLNMEDGQIRTITDETGCGLLSCGFLDEDLVYAVRAKEDWEQEGFLYRRLYEELVIVDGNLDEQSRYRKEQIFLSGIQLEAYSIRVERAEKRNGTYQKTADDVITLTEHPAEAGIVEIKVATSQIKRNYYYINLGRIIPESSRLSTDKAKLVSGEPRLFSLGSQTEASEIYTAYAGGRVCLRTGDLAQAVQAVYDTMGAVYRGGSPVWNRGMRDLYLTVKLPVMSWTQPGHEEEMAAMDSLERGVDILIYAGVNAGIVDEETAAGEERKACASAAEELALAFKEKMLVLHDCQIGHLLYYLNLRHPVLAINGDGTALILVGYTSSDVQIYDPATRETATRAQSEAQAYFEEKNTVFVTF